MKKLIIVFFVLGAISFTNAQEFKYEMGYLFPQSGLDTRTSGLNGSVAYLFKINNTLSLGPSVNYFHIFGPENKDQFGGDLSFLPVAADLQIRLEKLVENPFVIGIKAGYNVLSNDALNDKFFYEPYIAYGFIRLSYSNFSFEQGEYPILNLGLLFRLSN